MFRFEDPYFLILLIFIPLIIYHYMSKKGGLKITFSSLNIIKAIRAKNLVFGQHFLLALRLVAITLIILAVARPQIHNKVTEVISSGIDIMLVLDTSGSMKEMDYTNNYLAANRLDVVKDVVKEFINKRPSDRMGMVIFGTEAFTQCPITLDHNILNNLLRETQIGMVGQATAMGNAVAIAIKRLKDIKSKSKIIILLTDGRSNAGQIAPLTAAEIAKTFGIKIYTIGVGSKYVRTSGYYMSARAAQSTLDEETLTKMANITGGKYFLATDTAGLKEIYKTIDDLEKTKIKIKEYGKNTELFGRFLTVALLAFLLEIILANTILCKIP
ncbi:MAG: VWA domain-containing protein [Vampirovibrionia bacterium]